ncbi:MAG: PhoD-like phosphatase N-terminal domain-containing protein, partial [Bacteroidota bacterium]
MKLGLFILLFFSYFTLLSQSSFLQSGPMVGHAEVKSVQLWVQTTDAAKVHFNFWEKEAGKSKMRTSNSLETKAEEAFTAKVKLTNLTPGKTYQYQLFINDQAIELPYATTFQTQALWKYRSDPPDFKIAIGSCTFINEKAADRPGRPYGSDYKIFN